MKARIICIPSPKSPSPSAAIAYDESFAGEVTSQRGQPAMSEPLRIGFLGAGKMATALAQGWIQAGLTVAAQVCASDPESAARTHFTKTTGASAVAENSHIPAQSNVVVLAVKPQNMPELLAALRPELNAKHLLI